MFSLYLPNVNGLFLVVNRKNLVNTQVNFALIFETVREQSVLLLESQRVLSGLTWILHVGVKQRMLFGELFRVIEPRREFLLWIEMGRWFFVRVQFLVQVFWIFFLAEIFLRLQSETVRRKILVLAVHLAYVDVFEPERAYLIRAVRGVALLSLLRDGRAVHF